MVNNETTSNHPPADGQGKNPTCRYCGVGITTSKPWQAFCNTDHKKAFEKIQSELIAGIRQPLYRAAEAIAAARLNRTTNGD